MAKVRVHSFTMSIDGYVAGPDQSLENPMGIGGRRLHPWAFATRAFRKGLGMEGGEDGLDNEWAARGWEGIGATVMGRNMFGPVRGPWPDEEWRGWWGEEPPYHHPVYVLTNHPREPLEMEGGTTFHFVTDGIESALEQAVEAAAGKDVRIGGGASTVRQYLEAGLIDLIEMEIVPVLLGGGERFLDDLGAALVDRYEVTDFVGSENVTHIRIERGK